ncbi:hypothetical protein L596_002973 [Steinernema carpocapsae]|uniref:C2H2-type domain-containing protein n=1 Tax=Steinernema carpocapsae TaxID=34508 RepID=A0A4U8USQ6_STECR|nr:hypothetical protein L596_002973 [Steinernema carpocapsae]
MNSVDEICRRLWTKKNESERTADSDSTLTVLKKEEEAEVPKITAPVHCLQEKCCLQNVVHFHCAQKECNFHSTKQIEMDAHFVKRHTKQTELPRFAFFPKNIACPLNCEFSSVRSHLHCNRCYEVGSTRRIISVVNYSTHPFI